MVGKKSALQVGNLLLGLSLRDFDFCIIGTYKEFFQPLQLVILLFTQRETRFSFFNAKVQEG